MVYRITLCAAALMSCLSLSVAAAEAQDPNCSVSGPANGTNVIPSTACQKERMIEGRSVSPVWSQFMGSLVAAGAPGIEGLPGTESGR
jgi:hypothetical protein